MNANVEGETCGVADDTRHQAQIKLTSLGGSQLHTGKFSLTGLLLQKLAHQLVLNKETGRGKICHV